jgi:hypothetical protein
MKILIAAIAFLPVSLACNAWPFLKDQGAYATRRRRLRYLKKPSQFAAGINRNMTIA